MIDHVSRAFGHQLSLKQAILATLTYSDHFSFPLTRAELTSRLLGYPVPHSGLDQALSSLRHRRLIEVTRDYYHLPGRARLVSLRARRLRWSLPLRERALRLTRLLRRVPGVMAIYLTGSLAVANATPGSDIDLMVITRPGLLWSTRFLLTIFTSLLKLRRTPHSHKNSGKLCLNLYLTPDSYAIPYDRRSLYTAYELIQATPLYDPLATHPDLLAANRWIKDYLPNFRSLAKTPNVVPTLSRDTLGPIYRIFESLAYLLQLLYMRGHLTRELVTRDSAFFHPHNPGQQVLTRLRVK